MKKPLYVSLAPLLNPADLPRPLPWSTYFGPQHRVEVEIGFGNGEYLAQLCAKDPHTLFVGFEQYAQRIHRSLRKLSRVPQARVKILRLDAKAGLEYYFGEKSIDKIHCLYPPPWPKKSDIRHRLFSHVFLKTLNNRLVDNGVFVLVTDFAPYMEWLQEEVKGTGFDAQLKVIAPQYGTKFENKWVSEGQKEFYELTMIKKEHMVISPKEDIAVQTVYVKSWQPEKMQLSDFSDKDISVALKDITYDAQRQKALIYAIITEDRITQHVYIAIRMTPSGWMIHVAPGTMMMPSRGVAQALKHVHALVLATEDGVRT